LGVSSQGDVKKAIKNRVEFSKAAKNQSSYLLTPPPPPPSPPSPRRPLISAVMAHQIGPPKAKGPNAPPSQKTVGVGQSGWGFSYAKLGCSFIFYFIEELKQGAAEKQIKKKQCTYVLYLAWIFFRRTI
jgi:hypothetical protein